MQPIIWRQTSSVLYSNTNGVNPTRTQPPMQEETPQNYHVAGAWSNQWLHVCSSQTDLLTFSPLDSHRSPGNPSLTPTPPRSTFPLLSVEHLHRPTSPAYLTHIERPDSAPELLVVLSVIDKGGQIEIQAERLHKHSWTVCVFLSVVTGWDKGWMDAWTTIWQTCSSWRQRTGWRIIVGTDTDLIKSTWKITCKKRQA